MSRSCDLTGVKAQMGRRVPINRSQTGVRTKRSFAPNIQKVSVLSDSLGKISLRLAVKTIRSIEHNGGLDKFLLTAPVKSLTEKGRKLQKAVVAANGNKKPAEKPVRRQDKKSPRSIAAAKLRGGKKEAKAAKAPKAAAAKKPAAKKAAE